jgi:hypothetical protein
VQVTPVFNCFAGTFTFEPSDLVPVTVPTGVVGAHLATHLQERTVRTACLHAVLEWSSISKLQWRVIVAQGWLLHLGVHLHQIILFIVIITSHLLYSLAAKLAVGHRCAAEGILRNTEDILFPLIGTSQSPFTPKPRYPGWLCGSLLMWFNFEMNVMKSDTHLFPHFVQIL